MTWGVSHIAVTYEHQAALRDVSLELAAGTIVAVVGADGAGKTTLLRVLAGLREPDRGRVHRPVPRQLGYVSAVSAVHHDLTVDENLAFVAHAYRVRDAGRRRSELLDTTGLTAARDRLAQHLSGGMRQKLGVAMAVMHRPGLLILDEPTTGLDPVSRVEIWGMLAAEAAHGTAVVVSTTYLEEAERASHVLVLDDGRPLVAGAPDDVVARVPGTVLEGPTAPEGLARWRRGRRWRAWSPEGPPPSGMQVVHPDLEDAVIVAALRRATA